MKTSLGNVLRTLLCSLLCVLLVACSPAKTPEADNPAATAAGVSNTSAPTATSAPAETPDAKPAEQEEETGAGMTLEEFCAGHGSLVSTTGQAVSEEQLLQICEAVSEVTIGNENTWHITIITNQDLMQELLPTYAHEGLIQEGNAAIIVSCTSDTGEKDQYSVKDNTAVMAAGMVTQQICVAAQMQGLAFKVITENIRESAYTLYIDNIADEAHLLQESKDWDTWRRQFAIPSEKYYVLEENAGPIKTMGDEYVTLGNGVYTYYEADGVTPAYKRTLAYETGYMTPCAVVLLGYSEDAPQHNKTTLGKLYTIYDGSYDPYPAYYGGSVR